MLRHPCFVQIVGGLRSRTYQITFVAVVRSLCLIAVPIGVVVLCCARAGADPTLTTLATFNGANGNEPALVTLIIDRTGNLYGTTVIGGTYDGGTVFKLSAASNYAINTLVALNDDNGIFPETGLAADGAGNLYGTAERAGNAFYGTVFKLDASNNYAIANLVEFNNSNGSEPRDTLILDGMGNLYGTTLGGGLYGMGTVFRLNVASNYSLSTLATFDGANGANPMAGLISDSAGNLYGTASSGGANGKGTVFKLDATNNYSLTTLATFTGDNGVAPTGSLIADAAGNLYGTASRGGSSNDGIVFKLTAADNYAFTTLISFIGINGNEPLGGLIADSAGNLYGTTTLGGLNNDGTVFKLSGTGFLVPEPSSLALLSLASLLVSCFCEGTPAAVVQIARGEAPAA